MSNAAAALVDDVAFYEPRTKTVQVNFRIPEDLRASLLDLARLWTHLERQRDPEAPAVTLTEAAVRLLRVGEAGAWAEVGGRPTDETAWRQLLKVATEKLGAASKK